MTITRNFSTLANGAGSANTLSLGGATLGSNALAVTGTAAISGATTAGTLAIGGATLGSNALAVTGTAQTSGNVGVGATAPAWYATVKSVNANCGGIAANTTNTSYVYANIYYDGSNYRTINTGASNFMYQSAGTVAFYQAPSVTAGSVATPVQTFTMYPGTGGYYGDNPVDQSANPGRLALGAVYGGGSVLVYGANTNSGNNYSYFGPTIGSGVYTYESATAFNYSYRVFNGNGLVGSINMSGSTTTFSTTSDETLKNFDVPQRDFKSIIKNVMVQDGEFKADPGDYMLMISAQQCAATGYVDGINCWDDRPDENTGVKATHWSADYARLAPLALWGVKDLYAENEALKARVAALEAKVN